MAMTMTMMTTISTWIVGGSAAIRDGYTTETLSRMAMMRTTTMMAMTMTTATMTMAMRMMRTTMAMTMTMMTTINRTYVRARPANHRQALFRLGSVG